MTESTPAHAPPRALNVVRRDLRFDFADRDLRTWHPDGLHVAHFFNALSIFFPEGEKFFIDSVRHYRDRIRSPRLQREVKGFVGQEAMHSREHRRYNEALGRGRPADRSARGGGEAPPRAGAQTGRRPPNALAATIALEHFTAIMADVLLSDDRLLAGADPRLAEVWRWHAIEETEHKAVAYDVYCEARGHAIGPPMCGASSSCS